MANDKLTTKDIESILQRIAALESAVLAIATGRPVKIDPQGRVTGESHK